MASLTVISNKDFSHLDPVWTEIITEEIESTMDDYHGEIQSLDCSGMDIINLAPLRLFGELEVLDISSTQIKDIELLGTLPRLKEFHGSFCEGFDLEQISTCTNLEVIDLSYPIGSARNLKVLSQLPNLRELYLNACQISTVIDFMEMPNLEVLSLYFNPIPKEEIDFFREVYPSCKVLF